MRESKNVILGVKRHHQSISFYNTQQRILKWHQAKFGLLQTIELRSERLLNVNGSRTSDEFSKLLMSFIWWTFTFQICHCQDFFELRIYSDWWRSWAPDGFSKKTNSKNLGALVWKQFANLSNVRIEIPNWDVLSNVPCNENVEKILLVPP